jgi:hypothetical protein
MPLSPPCPVWGHRPARIKRGGAVVGTCAVLLIYLFGIGGFYSYAGRLRNTISAFLHYCERDQKLRLKKISVCHKAGSTFSINASPNRGPFAYFQDLMDIVRSTIDNT